MPVGYRVLTTHTLHRGLSAPKFARLKTQHKNINPELQYGITDHPDDTYITWDNGARVVASRFNGFFKRYRDIGGKVDFFVLDFEKGMSNWHFHNNPEILTAITNDLYSRAVVEKLGFNDLSLICKWRDNNEYLKWNAAMYVRLAKYVNQSVFYPIKKYFPEVKMSNYKYNYYNAKYPVPDTNGHKYYLYGNGAHAGTHQAPPLYCTLQGVSRKKLDGINLYNATPFNGLRFSINVLRSAALSSEVPLSPWISHKKFKESLVRNSDLYQELIFHCGLTGVSTFLLWNPDTWKPNQNREFLRDEQQDKLVNDCLTRLDELAGYAPQQSMITNIVPWGADYILTGLDIPSGSIWRFTPRMGKEQNIEDFIIRRDPAILQTATSRIEIPYAKILNIKKPLSANGLWIKSTTKRATIKKLPVE